MMVAVSIAAGMLVVWNGWAADGPSTPPPAEDPSWAGLDAQARCDSATELVTHGDRWLTLCRWRSPGEAVQGQAFPPPKGAPPYDVPRVEIYVAHLQSREELANAIAHELGHMHHTREFGSLPEWLAARDLPAQTPDEVWTEDYAEVFAALFSPPAEHWRAPTPRPGPRDLLDLRERFFS